MERRDNVQEEPSEKKKGRDNDKKNNNSRTMPARCYPNRYEIPKRKNLKGPNVAWDPAKPLENAISRPIIYPWGKKTTKGKSRETKSENLPIEKGRRKTSPAGQLQ